MYTKDIERVARGMIAEHLEVDYIRFYLMESYQLDRKTADLILEKIGAVEPTRGPKGPGKPAEKNPKVAKQSFY